MSLNYQKCYWIQQGNLTSLQLSEWVGAHVPVLRQMQIKDHAKYLGVVIGPSAAAHRWTKSRNTLNCCMCPPPRLRAELGSKTSFIQSVCPFRPLLRWVGCRTVENLALQRHSAGTFHALPSAMHRRRSACGLKIDVDGIQLTSKAARFRVASRSAQLSTGMACIRAAKDHCGRTLDSFARSWDDRSFRTSTAYCTATALQLVSGMDSLRSSRDLPFHKMQSGAATMLRQSGNILDIASNRSNRALGFVNQHRVHLLVKGLCRTANSCKGGLVVGALRIACNGLYTGVRFHTAEENPGCLLGCPEGLDCLRHYNCCPTSLDHINSLWPGTSECISPTAIFNDLCRRDVDEKIGLNTQPSM